MHTVEMAVHKPKDATRTWAAVAFCLFIMLPIREVVHLLWPQSPAPAAAVAFREGLILACAAGLLLFVRYVEKLPFTSIGLGTSVWWKSVLWAVITAALCLAAAGSIMLVTKFDGGRHAHDFDKLPLWLVTVVVFRAGFVEELFYRGYAIERLRSLGWPRAVAALVPLVIFAAMHYTGGPVNILMSFTLGAILTAFYLWRRDLVANIIAHFLVDFIANVVPRMVR
jgi:membrane protease YdiL (CAAX protease family)